MTTNDTDLDTQLAPLAAELAALQDARANIDDRIDQVKARILHLTDGPDTYSAGGLQVQVTVAHTIDRNALAAKYPADAHPELYSLAVDLAKVKRHIPAVDLEAFQVPSKSSVKLR